MVWHCPLVEGMCLCKTGPQVWFSLETTWLRA